MNIRGVDPDRCTRCFECVLDCPPGLFTDETDRDITRRDASSSMSAAAGVNISVTGVAADDETNMRTSTAMPAKHDTIVFADPLGRCIGCGHCVAVCPVDAILFDDAEPVLDTPGIEHPESIVPFDTFSAFALARRSVRRFKRTPVPDDAIGKIIDIMRRSPTASNRQGQGYIVITDPAARDALARSVLGLFRMIKRLLPFRFLAYPFIGKNERKLLMSRSTAPAINGTIRDFKRGRDRVFFHAPCVIVIHAPSYGNMAASDAGIALGHGMLAAQSLGLGTCWIGFAQEAFARVRGLAAEFGVPKGNRVHGVLALGYPDVRYHRIPPRKAARVHCVRPEED